MLAVMWPRVCVVEHTGPETRFLDDIGVEPGQLTRTARDHGTRVLNDTVETAGCAYRCVYDEMCLLRPRRDRDDHRDSRPRLFPSPAGILDRVARLRARAGGVLRQAQEVLPMHRL